MTTIDTQVGATTQGTVPSFVTATGHWVTSADHKKIGRLFIGWSLIHAIEVAVIGALFGFERISPSHMQILNGDSIIQLDAYYNHLLVLGTLAPLLLGIAIAVVPMQVGSKAISFPRLAQFSFWSWLFGSGLVLVSILGNGGPGGGNADMVDLYLLGVATVCVALIAGSVSVATTVLTSRAPGMQLDIIPSFSWSALVGSIATLLSLPVAIGTIIYLYVDHEHAKVAFDGNSGVSKWLGWVLTTPQIFVFVVMALGVLAEVAPVTARTRQPQRAAVLVGLALVTTAVLGAVTQTSHMLDTSGSGSDTIKSAIFFLLFNGLPLLGVVASVAVALLSFKDGSPSVNAPFGAALLGAFMVLLGALSSFIAHITSVDVAGTTFAEGTTLAIVYGSVLASVGALTYWAPKLWGVVLPDQKVLGVAALGTIGTVLAALPLFIAGFQKQPKGAAFGFDYDGPIALWNLISGIGSLLVVVSVLGFIGLLVKEVRSGAQAPDDPWNAHTLEWSIPSPAPTNNFAELPKVFSSEPLLDAKPAHQEVGS